MKDEMAEINVTVDVNERIESLAFNMNVAPHEIVNQAITGLEVEYAKSMKKVKIKGQIRMVSDRYYALYDAQFGGKPGWGAKETKRVKELFKRYGDNPQRIINVLEFMFEMQDELWTSHLGTFTSITSFAFIDRAIAKHKLQTKALETETETEKYPDTGEIEL